MRNVRWGQAPGATAAELGRRAELERRIERWWSAFRAEASTIDEQFTGTRDFDLPAWMTEHLQSIHPELMWEFGPAVNGPGHRLVITPEHRKDLRPLVARILTAAPELEGWEFYQHRLAETLERAQQTVEARCGRAPKLSGVIASTGEDNQIDLTFVGAGVSSEKDEDAEYEAFVLSEALLGERVLDRWIGRIGVRPPVRRGPLQRLLREQGTERMLPLGELAETVTHMIEKIRVGLPDRPYLSLLDQVDSWSLLELEPVSAEEYAEQLDLFVAKTPNLDLWRATREPAFYSERYSRSGETFCYLKLDGSQGLDQEKFADKGEIEDALDALLIPARWGCQIGGGTGLRYSYIELALTDETHALPAIRRLLAEGNVPLRSWILFHDCERRSEWIGVHDTTPTPPMAE